MDGKKTYTAGIALIGAAVFGFMLGVAGYENGMAIDANEAVQMLLEGLGLIGIRHGISKASGV